MLSCKCCTSQSDGSLHGVRQSIADAFERVSRDRVCGKNFLWMELHGNDTAWNTCRHALALSVSVIFAENSFHDNCFLSFFFFLFIYFKSKPESPAHFTFLYRGLLWQSSVETPRRSLVPCPTEQFLLYYFCFVSFLYSSVYLFYFILIILRNVLFLRCI